jgi:phospholipid/cholesterol/gamma-HCH transport system substrate-binding protein
VCTEVKSFAERNLVVIGVVGTALTIVASIGALEYEKLPFLSSGGTYSAYFAEAGGLTSGAAVQVSGMRVGQVSSIELDHSRVLVTFEIDGNVHIGDRSEAAVKTKTLLGAKVLEVTPRGDGTQDGPIPLDRTRPAYQLPDALGDLASTISGLNTNQVSDSLAVLADTFSDTPESVRTAVQGVARFSATLNARDDQLRNLLANANKVTGVLAEHGDQVVSLIANANALLLQLESESSALDQISANISAVTQQLSGFVADNRQTFKPALEKLNGALAIVNNHKAEVQKAIKLNNVYAMSLGESVGSGPFFKAYVGNLLPGQFVQPFVDAAFSDLGLDPNVLLPSQRTDPQVGQPGTPPLPIPLPRTGQGGAPNLTLPGAITGNPGDPRYPYQPPLPGPPPGGPPPGPPASAPQGGESTSEPTPKPVFEPAPGEPPPAGFTPAPEGDMPMPAGTGR